VSFPPAPKSWSAAAPPLKVLARLSPKKVAMIVAPEKIQYIKCELADSK
jgi:hypothetical protein